VTLNQMVSESGGVAYAFLCPSAFTMLNDCQIFARHNCRIYRR